MLYHAIKKQKNRHGQQDKLIVILFGLKNEHFFPLDNIRLTLEIEFA